MRLLQAHLQRGELPDGRPGGKRTLLTRAEDDDDDDDDDGDA